MQVSQELKFSAHGSNENFDFFLFLDGPHSRNFCFDSRLIEKDVCCAHIGKGMANKETSEKFGVPSNTISTGMKCRVFF